MSIQITDMSKLGKAFIMQGIKANIMLSKRGELERTSIIWTEVIERDELES